MVRYDPDGDHRKNGSQGFNNLIGENCIGQKKSCKNKTRNNLNVEHNRAPGGTDTYRATGCFLNSGDRDPVFLLQLTLGIDRCMETSSCIEDGLTQLVLSAFRTIFFSTSCWALFLVFVVIDNEALRYTARNRRRENATTATAAVAHTKPILSLTAPGFPIFFCVVYRLMPIVSALSIGTCFDRSYRERTRYACAKR